MLILATSLRGAFEKIVQAKANFYYNKTLNHAVGTIIQHALRTVLAYHCVQL